MPVNVVMPQMGESVAEGTVVRWIKKVGDNVDRDEPLFEISTDKVDAEIPSPAAGTLSAIHVKEGETVPVDTVVALIAQGGEAVAAAPAAPASSTRERAASAAKKAASTSASSATAEAPPPATPQADGSPATAYRTASATERIAGARSGGCTGGRRAGRPQRLRLGRIRSGGHAGVARGHVARRTAASAVVTARAQDRERAQRRHLADLRIGHQRTRHQEGHPRLHRASSRRRRAGAAAAGARAPHAGDDAAHSGVRAGRTRRSRADDGDAQEDRRAHDLQHAHLGARPLGVRGRLHAGVEDPRREEGRIRARGHQAHVPVVHREGDGRRAARHAGAQLVDRRRIRRLQEGHQHRHRGRARLGPDRPGDQARGRKEPARVEPLGRRPGGRARARRS